jgi:DNA helicase-2/ATP-dependent DNA helicase PcrA
MDRIEESLELLNEEQRRAVLHNGNSLLILAGAGSGKTRVITVKIAYLIERLGIDPRSILAVTFTNKAAGEMRERAASLSSAAEQVVIRTFHSFGAWLLRRNAAALGLSSSFTIYDDDDSISLLGSLLPDRSRQQLRYLAHLISRAKDNCLGPEDAVEAISGDPEFREAYRKYQERLQEIGNADFGDLILRPIELLEREPEIAARIRDRFRVILVDEYQDSNVAQYRLLTSLFQRGSYICVVGDDDQSIYRFRGAEVRNILNFPKQFDNTDIIRLEQNYRSTNPILQLAGAVVKPNEGRLGKELWTDREGGKLPVLARLSDQDAEVEYAIQLIRDEFDGETAILYRTNAQSRLFETRFLQEGIPYRIIGTLRFYEREEVKDAVALLKLLANPKDEVAFSRIVNKPSRGIGQVALRRILSQLGAARGNLVHAAEYAIPGSAKKTAKGMAEFVSCMEKAAGYLNAPSSEISHLGELVERSLEDSGLARYHLNQDEVTGSGKMQNLEELVNAASLYPANHEGLVEFLEAIELDGAREQNETDADVTLITMHNTKGLEFDRVMITGLENELFPRTDDGDRESLEEERRLFYVAITRARHELHITSCASRRIHGRIQSLSPSIFLREIPEALIDVYGGRQSSSSDGWRDTFGDSDPWAAWRGDAGGMPVVPEYGSAAGAGPDSGQDREMEYPPGQLVYHDEYGTGEVVKNSYNGSEEVILVRFESGATAQFIPRFSSVDKISRDW